MLTTIELIKKDGGVLTLPIYDPTNFAVIDVQGLDPVRNNIVTSNFSQMDGAQYQASRREMRNIVLKIRILSIPGEANVQELRKQLYEYLLPKSNVKIRFTQDYISTFSIEGQVESFDAPIFVKEPEATISILCFDPDFYKEVTTSFSGVSVISGSTSYSNLNYTGSVDTGFIFTITANDSTNSFTLESTSSDNVLRKMTFTDNTGLLASGDKIIVSTVPGDKYVKRVRSNVETSILWALDRTSDWIRLYPGYNEVAVKTAVTINHPYTIVYTDKVGGL
jgi:hypothetical protein